MRVRAFEWTVSRKNIVWFLERGRYGGVEFLVLYTYLLYKMEYV